MKVAQEPRTFIAARSIGAGIQNLLLTLATSDVFRHLWTGESP